MNKPKLLVITSTFPTFLPNDGTPSFVYELSKSIAKINDFQIVVLTPYIKNTKLFEEKDGLQIHRFKYVFSDLCDGSILANLKNNKLLWLQVPFLFFFYFVNLIKIIKKEKIKIIHAHWLIPQGLIATIYKKFINKNIKILCTIHGSDLLALKSSFYKFLQKFVISNTDNITTVSQALKTELLKITAINQNIQVIPMGVDSNKFNHQHFSTALIEKYGDFLLSVGRLSPEKGTNYLINSLSTVINKHPNLKLLIIGDGHLKSELYKQVENLKLNNHVIFLGYQSYEKLPAFFATAKIFILPSISEGLPLVCIEALLSQTCVITSDLLSLSDIIINNQTGLQINTKNAKLLSDNILYLLKNKEKKERLIRQGYNYAKNNFTLNIVANKYNNLLTTL